MQKFPYMAVLNVGTREGLPKGEEEATRKQKTRLGFKMEGKMA